MKQYPEYSHTSSLRDATDIAQHRDLDRASQRGVARALKGFIHTHDRYELETELYRKYRIPPVIVTQDGEVLFPPDGG